MAAEKKDHSKNKLFRDIFLDQQPNESFETKSRKLSAEEIQNQADKLIKAIEEDEQIKPPISKTRLPYFTGYKIAAAFVLLIIAIASYFLVEKDESNSIYQTGYGETRQIVLPDSSMINLNANSTLTYRPTWDDQQLREVWLSGEAFFDVRKKPLSENPKFIVHTNDLDVEVLGTRFNVQNRHEKTQVVLSSGKVKLNIADNKQEVLMEPGEMVAYSMKTNAYEKKKVDTQNYTSWKDNFLIFDNNTLAEIAAVLEDSYGMHINFKDPEIEPNRFTATIPTDKIEVLFPMLEESFHLQITKKDNDIMIKKKN